MSNFLWDLKPNGCVFTVKVIHHPWIFLEHKDTAPKKCCGVNHPRHISKYSWHPPLCYEATIIQEVDSSIWLEHEHKYCDEGAFIELVHLIDIFPGRPALTADLEEWARYLVQFLELVLAHVLLVVVVYRVQSLKLLLFQILVLLNCGPVLLNVVWCEEVTLCGFWSLNLLSFGLLIR